MVSCVQCVLFLNKFIMLCSVAFYFNRSSPPPKPYKVTDPLGHIKDLVFFLLLISQNKLWQVWIRKIERWKRRWGMDEIFFIHPGTYKMIIFQKRMDLWMTVNIRFSWESSVLLASWILKCFLGGLGKLRRNNVSFIVSCYTMKTKRELSYNAYV